MTQAIQTAPIVKTHVFVNRRLLVDHIILEADTRLTHEEIERYIDVLRREYEKYSDKA